MEQENFFQKIQLCHPQQHMLSFSGWKDGRTEGQTLIHRTLPATAGGLKTAKGSIYDPFSHNFMGKNFSHTLGYHFLFAALTKYFFVLMFASGNNCTIPRDILTANNTSHNFQLLTTTTQKETKARRPDHITL